MENICFPICSKVCISARNLQYIKRQSQNERHLSSVNQIYRKRSIKSELQFLKSESNIYLKRFILILDIDKQWHVKNQNDKAFNIQHSTFHVKKKNDIHVIHQCFGNKFPNCSPYCPNHWTKIGQIHCKNPNFSYFWMNQACHFKTNVTFVLKTNSQNTQTETPTQIAISKQK